MTDRLAQFPAETKEDGDEEEMRTALAAAKDLATDEKKTLSQHHVPIYTTFRITLVFIHCYSPLKKSRVNVLVGLRCSFYSFDNENLINSLVTIPSQFYCHPIIFSNVSFRFFSR